MTPGYFTLQATWDWASLSGLLASHIGSSLHTVPLHLRFPLPPPSGLLHSCHPCGREPGRQRHRIQANFLENGWRFFSLSPKPWFQSCLGQSPTLDPLSNGGHGHTLWDSDGSQCCHCPRGTTDREVLPRKGDGWADSAVGVPASVHWQSGCYTISSTCVFLPNSNKASIVSSRSQHSYWQRAWPEIRSLKERTNIE